MSAWSHLPNAAHIDAVLEDVRARPEVWAAAGEATWGAAWSAVRGVAQSAARRTTQTALRTEVWGILWRSVQGTSSDAARGAARDTIHALISWDESTALLDLTPDALRTIIDVADGDVKHQAVLLLPAVIARSTE